jgi:hypothetical protein
MGHEYIGLQTEEMLALPLRRACRGRQAQVGGLPHPPVLEPLLLPALYRRVRF